MRGITFCGTTNLAFLPGETNSRSYLVTLKEYLLPFAEEFYNANWIFQQDGASIHIFHAFQIWFQENKVSLLDLPVKFLDLNTVESL